ncbi:MULTISPECIES: WcbI family polysaccharide biosynthesis putative acetyltransferase [Pseudomonas]|nr:MULTISPECIES: WcbI family polysaccharide biosynthesis putative acetyltransferase [Pseudomonas]MEB0191013.1 WcbI family polysaccharide biosynthesis putative acetyltransferase [Pseudomonas sp. CCI1.1]WPX51476.1 WcbI family polysaccharide biosynthesis putative acetyltransferase [Pseudomonas sp. CCI1.1]
MGNCQSAPIKSLLQQRLNVPCEIIQIKPVHLLKEHDIKGVIATLSSSDVVVTHLISNNYNNFPIGTGQLVDTIKAGAKIIVVPNAHYIGYFPSFIYIKDSKGRGVTPRVPEYSHFPSDYHDAFCIAAKIKGYSLEKLFEFYENYKGAADWLEGYIDESLLNLREREQDCDIKISDFIEDNYKNRQLFWTFNHPTNELLIYMVDQVIDKLGLSPVQNKATDEYLQEAILPIFPFISKNLGISFDAENFSMEGIDSYRKYVSLCWSGYEKSQEVLDVNRKNRRVVECMDILNKFDNAVMGIQK